MNSLFLHLEMFHDKMSCWNTSYMVWANPRYTTMECNNKRHLPLLGKNKLHFNIQRMWDMSYVNNMASLPPIFHLCILGSFSNRLCWIRKEERPKERPQTPLYVNVCLVFMSLSFIEEWSLQKETWKEGNLWCGIRGRGLIRNGWHGSIDNDTL